MAPQMATGAGGEGGKISAFFPLLAFGCLVVIREKLHCLVCSPPLFSTSRVYIDNVYQLPEKKTSFVRWFIEQCLCVMFGCHLVGGGREREREGLKIDSSLLFLVLLSAISPLACPRQTVFSVFSSVFNNCEAFEAFEELLLSFCFHYKKESLSNSLLASILRPIFFRSIAFLG